MPLRLPSLNIFRLSRKRENSAQHCIELVDLKQADADYMFQHEHSTWEESPAPPPNTLCAGSSVVLLQRHSSSHFGLALEFGADFEQDWLRRFGGLDSNSDSSSLTTVVHHAPFASTPHATADATAASEASTSISTLPKPPPNLAATIRGRFKSAFKSTINTTPNNHSTTHSSRPKTSRAHTNDDSTAAPHIKNNRGATTVASNARDRACPPQPPPPPMSNPARPPRRWRCCCCGRVNAKAKANARAYDTNMANRNRNRNRSTQDHGSKTAVAVTATVTAMEDGTWTCRCGHSFEPCVLMARLRCLRRVQRKGGNVGVAFGRG